MKMLGLSLCLALLPVPAVLAQSPRDTPPPAIEMARRERELRAIVAGGTATKDTYLELAGLANRQGNFAKTIDALEPDNPEGYHRVATFYWEKANKDTGLSAAEKRDFIVKGLAMEDKALGLNPNYADAMTYKNILLRMQANQQVDPAERSRLIAEADVLRDRVIEMAKREHAPKPSQDTPEPPPPPPFQGFPEAFDQTIARLQPVRIGGDTGVRMPTKVRDAKPVYPDAARAAGVQGVVIVEAVIDESGAVANARILRSIPVLDQSALAAVSQWRYGPSDLNGRPLSVIMTVTVLFTLQ